MPKNAALTVRQLHNATEFSVRRASVSKVPVPITDRGKLVAVLANPALVRPTHRNRVLLPEFKAMMSGAPASDAQAALDKVRCER